MTGIDTSRTTASGLKLLDLGHGILAVFGLAANLEARLLRQDHAHPGRTVSWSSTTSIRTLI